MNPAMVPPQIWSSVKKCHFCIEAKPPRLAKDFFGSAKGMQMEWPLYIEVHIRFCVMFTAIFGEMIIK